MDLILLETFVEVSKTRNFGQASVNLNVSSSTVSARIKQLEELLGLTLFIRRHHEISLTPAGEGLERHARFILSAWDRAYEETALGARQQQRLVVAGVSSLWDIFIQDWLNEVYRIETELSIRAEESTPLRVVEKLDQGLIDIGFMYEPPSIRGVEVREIATVPMVLVSDKRDITPQQAVTEGYIRVEWGTAFGVQHESHFPQRPLARARVNTAKLAHKLILGHGGAAYLPEIILDEDLKQGRIHKVEGAPVIEMKAYAAFNLHGEHSELIKTLLNRL